VGSTSALLRCPLRMRGGGARQPTSRVKGTRGGGVMRGGGARKWVGRVKTAQPGAAVWRLLRSYCFLAFFFLLFRVS